MAARDPDWSHELSTPVRAAVEPPALVRHYVTPGNLLASREPASITTVVGSCVAICLWDPARRIGGLNHYQLPRCPHRSMASGRFGDTAFQLLLDRLAELGAERRSLRARIVGGACLLAAVRDRATHLGRQNADVGVQLVRSAGIQLVQQDTGGSSGRRIVFRTDDGSAVVQPI